LIGLFKRYIEEGREDETIELKLSYHPGEATREIVAMANAGRRGYILFGVAEASQRSASEPFISSQNEHFSNPDLTERQLREFMLRRVNPVPPFRVYSMRWTTGELLGVVAVGLSDTLHEFTQEIFNRQNEPICRPGTFIMRDGVQVRAMSLEDINRRLQQISSATAMKFVDVINFGHALTEEQIKELRDLGYNVGIPNLGEMVHLNDNEPLGPQVERILDSFGYSKAEWERCGTDNLFVLPTHAEIAGVFLAQLHGRMGHFPRIIRRVRGADGAFHVTEVIDLQNMRLQQRARAISV